MIRKTYNNLIQNDEAVSVILGHVLNFGILLLITGSIVGVFYLKAEDSSQKAMTVGYTDLGSQISRDITNAYIISENSDNISIKIKRPISMTIGGKGYRIKFNNGTSTETAHVDISEDSVNGYLIVSPININNNQTNITGTIYSGSGIINIDITKNNESETIYGY